MTTAADHDRAAEDAFEALLDGRPAPGGAAGLAAFTGAVRDAADRPGRPNAALAELLSTGLLTDQSSPSARTAPAAGIPSGSRGRTRRRFTVIVPALIAKFLAAGAVAQAAAGAGVVVVVVAGAGTAGALPDDAQTAFSDLTGIGETTEEPTDELLPPTEEVVQPVEGDGSLDPADPTTPPVVEVPEPTDDEPVELTDAEKAAAWAEAGKAVKTQAEFKAWLAEGKDNGWVTGQAVSAAAHARNEARKAPRAGGEDSEETPEVESPEVESPEEEVDEQEDESEDSGKDREDSGKDSDGGKGKSRD